MNKPNHHPTPAPPDPARIKSVRPGDAAPCPELIKRTLAGALPILFRAFCGATRPFHPPTDPCSRVLGTVRAARTAAVSCFSQENPPKAFSSLAQATGRS
jgi:hypothetical protein